jgi:hypothetical protein
MVMNKGKQSMILLYALIGVAVIVIAVGVVLLLTQ